MSEQLNWNKNGNKLMLVPVLLLEPFEFAEVCHALDRIIAPDSTLP
jgi:hypothetical protein